MSTVRTLIRALALTSLLHQANGTVAVETTSGASRSVAVSSGAFAAAVALVGLL